MKCIANVLQSQSRPPRCTEADRRRCPLLADCSRRVGCRNRTLAVSLSILMTACGASGERPKPAKSRRSQAARDFSRGAGVRDWLQTTSLGHLVLVGHKSEPTVIPDIVAILA